MAGGRDEIGGRVCPSTMASLRLLSPNGPAADVHRKDLQGRGLCFWEVYEQKYKIHHEGTRELRGVP